MLLRATLIAAAIAVAALTMTGLGPALAHADPNQRCTAPVWVTDMGIPSAPAPPASTRTAATRCARPSGRRAMDPEHASTTRLPPRPPQEDSSR
jgi:hypothetical protein